MQSSPIMADEIRSDHYWPVPLTFRYDVRGSLFSQFCMNVQLCSY